MRNPRAAVMERRYFCSLIAGLLVSVIGAKLSFGIEQKLRVANADEEFVIVNGWVLTREDLAASDKIPDVV